VAYGAHCRVTPRGRRGPQIWTTAMAEQPFEALARACDVPMQAMMLQRRPVIELGGFDTSLETCEDWDLLQRLARRGGGFVGVKSLVAFHHLSRDSLTTDVPTLQRDGLAVIDRGFAVDPRVADPARRHIVGADPHGGCDRPMARGLYALWCAAVETGRGGDGQALLEPLPSRTDWLIDACRATLLDGLGAGARRLPVELSHDREHGAGPLQAASLRRLLAVLGDRSGQPDLARELAWVLAPDVFDGPDAAAALVIGSTLHVRRTATRLADIAVPPEVERVRLEVRHDNQVVARLDLDPAKAMNPSNLAGAILQAMGLRRFLSANRLWQLPLFWWHTALAAAGSVQSPALLRRSLAAAAIATTLSRHRA
jgi:hypothetical protein